MRPGEYGLEQYPPALAINIGTFAADGTIAGGRWVLFGGSFQNNNASSARITCYDGQDTTGEIVLSTGSVGNNAVSTVWLGAPGIYIQRGLFLHGSAFPWVGALYAVPLDRHHPQWHSVRTAMAELAAAMEGLRA